MLPTQIDPEIIKQAVQALQAGQLVAFPTETVYGLGADAQNEKAVRRLFKAKGRPTSHPVIVHLAEFEQIYDWCYKVPKSAKTLADHFWPGPLTMILPRSNKATDLVTGGQDTLGVRIPRHAIAHALIKSFGDGIVAPSANKFGRVSPTNAEHVRAEFGNEVAIVLDGGSCDVGIESTIVDLSGRKPQILRPGMIPAKAISEVLGLKQAQELTQEKHVVRVPGALPRHYATQTPLLLMRLSEILALIQYQNYHQCSDKTATFAVLSFAERPDSSLNSGTITAWIIAAKDATTYAKSLYSNLRQLDASGAALILVERPPKSPPWVAILDRLERASRSDIKPI